MLLQRSAGAVLLAVMVCCFRRRSSMTVSCTLDSLSEHLPQAQLQESYQRCSPATSTRCAILHRRWYCKLHDGLPRPQASHSGQEEPIGNQ